MKVTLVTYVEKYADLILIREGEKKRYVLIKDFDRFMYDHSLHHGRKYFCRYCLHAFITEIILKSHVKYCLKFSGKQTIKNVEKG